MTEVLLFHHAQGQTPGFLALADELRAAGHVVHAPDLYEGRTFEELDAGVAYCEELGFPEILRRGGAAAEGLPSGIVYAGFSLGTVLAQMLAQTRPGARGALLFHGCLPTAEFEVPWPASVPLQVHTMDRDRWVELDVARALIAEVGDAELFLYPGEGHLFADASLGDYDARASRLLMQRALGFLERVAERGSGHPGTS